jgi:hypothetical protein
MWMIDRIHHDPSDVWTAAFPTAPAGLAHGDIFMVGVSNLSDGRLTRAENASHLSRLEADLDVRPLAPHDLRGTPGASY